MDTCIAFESSCGQAELGNADATPPKIYEEEGLRDDDGPCPSITKQYRYRAKDRENREKQKNSPTVYSGV
jgi:hypothetical protein